MVHELTSLQFTIAMNGTVSSQNPYVEALTPNVMVFRKEAFGR